MAVSKKNKRRSTSRTRKAHRKVRRSELTLDVADHNVPTTDRSKGIDDPESALQVATLEKNAKEFGVTYFAMDDIRQGIVHIVGPEQGFTQPGMTIVCGDSHTATHGAFGALAFGIGTSEVEHVLATQTLIQKPAKNMRIAVEGKPHAGVTAKDFILAIIGKIGTAGGTGHVIEFAGEAIAALSPEFRRPANGILPPGLPGYSPQPKALRHDLSRARELLAEAGHPRGRGLAPIRIYASQANARGRRTYDLVRSQLAEAGIPCTIVEADWAELSRRVEDHDAPGFMLGWVADIADPDAFLTTLFAPEGASNYFAFKDERAGKLMTAGGAEANPIERARIYREIERRILDLAPIVPLYHSLGTIARRSSVRGLDPGPLGLASVDLENVRLVESRP